MAIVGGGVFRKFSINQSNAQILAPNFQVEFLDVCKMIQHVKDDLILEIPNLIWLKHD